MAKRLANTLSLSLSIKYLSIVRKEGTVGRWESLKPGRCNPGFRRCWGASRSRASGCWWRQRRCRSRWCTCSYPRRPVPSRKCCSILTASDIWG